MFVSIKIKIQVIPRAYLAIYNIDYAEFVQGT